MWLTHCLRLCLVLTAHSVAVVFSQGYGDIQFECKPGYRITQISRQRADDGKVGVMDIQCEEFPGAVDAQCEKVAGPLNCDGSDEPCTEGSWLGGLHGYELDRNTGAVLLQPICCRDPKIKILTGSCSGHRLNSIRGKFDKKLRPDQLITSFKCWKQYDIRNVIHDFIWKPQVCNFEFDQFAERDQDIRRSSETRDDDGPDPSVCDECTCTCGPFKCEEGRRVARFTHARRKRATCECVCDCDFRCV